MVTAAWTFAGVLLYLWTPLTVPVLLPLCVMAPVGWCWAEGRLAFYEPAPAIIALALTGLYLLINASWSLAPATAYLVVLAMFIFVAATYLTLNAMRETDRAAIRAMAWGFYVALVAGSIFLCSELFSHQWMRRLLMSYIPALRPDPSLMVMQSGWVVEVPDFLLNRCVAAMTLLFWPALLLIPLLAITRRRHVWLLAGLVPLIAAIFRSPHATSKIAFVGATATFALFQVYPMLTKRIMRIGWIAAWLLVVPVAMAAYGSQLYLSGWLAHSAQHRIVIWGLTSRAIANAPLLGAGIDAARALNDPYSFDVGYAPGSDFRLSLGPHSHNVYLQTWYETGAVGALLLLGFGLLLLHSLGRAPWRAQPYLHALFAACALLGASSFGLWQPWFMASLGFVAAFAGLGFGLADSVTSTVPSAPPASPSPAACPQS